MKAGQVNENHTGELPRRVKWQRKNTLLIRAASNERCDSYTKMKTKGRGM